MCLRKLCLFTLVATLAGSTTDACYKNNALDAGRIDLLVSSSVSRKFAEFTCAQTTDTARAVLGNCSSPHKLVKERCGVCLTAATEETVNRCRRDW
jgi:hypothetical protein